MQGTCIKIKKMIYILLFSVLSSINHMCNVALLHCDRISRENVKIFSQSQLHAQQAPLTLINEVTSIGSQMDKEPAKRG